MKHLLFLFCFCLLVPLLVSGGVKRVKTDQKLVALTFDDGPNPPYTEQLLQILADKNVKASFFLIGQQVDQHSELARQIIGEGHEVGGHSIDWDSLAFKKRKTIEGKLNAMELSFANIGMTNLTLFRPPGGLLSPGQEKILSDRGYQHISADVVVGDWKKISADTIQKRVVKKVRPGSIIVLHDGGGNRSATITAIPIIIEELHRKGYSFLTVSELLEKR